MPLVELKESFENFLKMKDQTRDAAVVGTLDLS